MKRDLLFKTEWKLFMRNFFAVFFTLGFPVMMLLLYGGMFGNDPYPGTEFGTVDYSVPASVVMITGVTGLMSFPLTVCEYQQYKIYKRFDASPVGKQKVLLTQMWVNILMTLAGIALLLAVGKAVFDVRIPGKLWPIAFTVALTILNSFSMGVFLCSIVKDEKLISALCYTVYFVSLFLSGATFPDQMFPDAFLTVEKFIPMSYAVDLVQGAFLGDGMGMYKTEILVLAATTAVCLVFGIRKFGKKDWA